MAETVSIRGIEHELDPTTGIPVPIRPTPDQMAEFVKERFKREAEARVRAYTGFLDSEIKAAENDVASKRFLVESPAPHHAQIPLDRRMRNLCKAEAYLAALREEEERRLSELRAQGAAIEEQQRKAAADAAENALRQEFAALEAKEREQRYLDWKERKLKGKAPKPLSAVVTPRPLSDLEGNSRPAT